MKKINLIVLLFIGLVFVSCDKDFDELNQNPNNPTSIPSELLLGSMLRSTGDIMYSTFVGGDMGECWAQHWAKVQYNDEELYIPRESVIGSTWSTLYESVAADADAMYNLAVTEENLVSQGAALTMQAYAFLLLTDLYGDVPFNEALQGAVNISPVYDSQQAVYNGCLALLDDAMSKLNPANGSLDSSQDILYGGDVSKWRKFAASLKFRALMRMSGKDARASEMQALVNSGLLFSSSADEAKLVYLSASPNANPIYESVVFGTRNEWKINSAVVDRMDGTFGGFPIDNRLPVMAQKNDAGIYRGKPSGIRDVPSVEYSYANVSPLGTFYLQPELPAVFIGYTELQFLLAEAAFKGYISGGNGAAASYYQSGIASSFADNGVPMGGYYTGNVIFTPGFALEQIATQKWFGLYSQGLEAWTEWRRTGYPNLTPALEGAISQIPSRFTYPVIEQSLNAANYDAAVGNLPGGDKLTSPVWWMN